MGIVNLLAWGVVIWLLMRLFVFQFTTTTLRPWTSSGMMSCTFVRRF